MPQLIVLLTIRGGMVQDVRSTAPCTVIVEDWDCPPDLPLIMEFEAEELPPEQTLRLQRRESEGEAQ